jgi:hypothetical protein
MTYKSRRVQGGWPKRHCKVAHYIYTAPAVQYKRLFELTESPVNHRREACHWPVCRIDQKTRSGQDTGGFAFAEYLSKADLLIQEHL